MCVIVYKPMGKELPKKQLLENCFYNNPDGSGYMYNGVDKKVHIRKGFMTFEEFYDSLMKTTESLDVVNTSIVMHFRITTQGGVSKPLCHPYPLSKNMDDLKSLSIKSNIGVAHNGIIRLTSDYSRKNIDYNDTMKFITQYLSKIIKGNKNFYKSKDTLELIEDLCESKLAILDGDGHCQLIGGFVEFDGCMYSNYSYEDYQGPKYNFKWDDLVDEWEDKYSSYLGNEDVIIPENLKSFEYENKHLFIFEDTFETYFDTYVTYAYDDEGNEYECYFDLNLENQFELNGVEMIFSSAQ